MKLFEIKNRWSGELIFKIKGNSWKFAVEASIKEKVNLAGADLAGANLRVIKNDLWSVLLIAKNEVPNLRECLLDGKVDGSSYQGDMRGNFEDWIIKGIKGEFYPCKPEIFEATYEAVTE
jgi:hypothetical protein